MVLCVGTNGRLCRRTLRRRSSGAAAVHVYVTLLVPAAVQHDAGAQTGRQRAAQPLARQKVQPRHAVSSFFPVYNERRRLLLSLSFPTYSRSSSAPPVHIPHFLLRNENLPDAPVGRNINANSKALMQLRGEFYWWATAATGEGREREARALTRVKIPMQALSFWLESNFWNANRWRR